MNCGNHCWCDESICNRRGCHSTHIFYHKINGLYIYLDMQTLQKTVIRCPSGFLRTTTPPDFLRQSRHLFEEPCHSCHLSQPRTRSFPIFSPPDSPSLPTQGFARSLWITTSFQEVRIYRCSIVWQPQDSLGSSSCYAIQPASLSFRWLPQLCCQLLPQSDQLYNESSLYASWDYNKS